MPALPEEIVEADEEGVASRYLTAPVQVSDGKAACIRMEPGPRRREREAAAGAGERQRVFACL